MSLAFDFYPAVIPVIAAMVIGLFVGTFVLKKNPTVRANQYCAAMQFILALWVFGDILMFSAANEQTALLGQRILWAGACFIGSIGLQFTFVFTHAIQPQKVKFLSLLHIPGFLIYPYIIQEGIEVDPSGWFGYNIQHHAVFDIFTYWTMALILTAAMIMIYTYATSKSKIEKIQMKYLLVGEMTAIVFTPAFDLIFPMMEFDVPTIGTVFMGVMGIFFSYSVIKYKVFDIKAVTESMIPAQVESVQRLQHGNTYLVKEKGTRNSYEIFRGMVSKTPGLCVSTFHPQKFRQEYRLEKTPIIWLTETETEETALNPYRLDFEVTYTISNFMKESPETVILIDDLNYISMANGFDKTLEFLKNLVDMAAMHNSALILPLNTAFYSEQDLSAIEGCADEIIDTTSKGFSRKKFPLKYGYAYLIKESKPDSTFDIFKSLSEGGKGICLTKTFPDKLRKQCDLGDVPMYWLSNMESENAISPNRLQFELAQTIYDFAEKNPRSVVVLDGIEHLVNENGFDAVAEFMKSTVDKLSVCQTTLLIPVRQDAYNDTEFAILENRVDHTIDATGDRLNIESKPEGLVVDFE